MIQRISRTECVALYKIEIHFFDALADAGLIVVEQENEEFYVDYEELNMLERYANLHYDLDINVAGIEVIARLLNNVKALQEENRILMQQSRAALDKASDWVNDF